MRGAKRVLQLLVQWSNGSTELATWEDLETLKQMFPRAPAWGQAASQQGEIVSNMGTAEQQEEAQSRARPIRKPHLPTRLAGPEWALGLVTP
uniref:Chromo domain-containing protein n=1 Tax=Triticum urartu TaxID=4572 RepID=A0A8R7UV01_TRIUA